MMRRTPSERVGLGASVLAGIVLAHGIAYALAYPDPHRLDLHLASTGHSDWRLAAAVAVGAALLALGLWGLAGLRGAASAPGPGLWLRLFGAQAVALVALESMERAISGAGPVWNEPALWTALPVLAAVAGLVLVALRFAHAFGRRLAARPRRVAPRLRTLPSATPRSTDLPHAPGALSYTRRGPPLSVSA